MEERAQGSDDVGRAAVEVEIGEIAHLPSVGGEPVHSSAVALEASAVEMGHPVVLNTDSMFPVAKVEAVERYPVAVRNPQLRLWCRQTAVDQHKAKLTFLSALCPWISAADEFARLTDPTQAIVPSDLDQEFVRLASADPKTQVQQWHRVHSANGPRQIHRTSGSRRTGNTTQKHRVVYGQHRLVGYDSPDVWHALPSRHDDVHVGAPDVAKAMQLRTGVEADHRGVRQTPEDRRQMPAPVGRWRVDTP
ncbi:hypothetical protein ACTFTM_05985 [Micromonospora sp. RB23]